MLGTVPQQHSLTFLEKLFILRLVHSTNFTLTRIFTFYRGKKAYYLSYKNSPYVYCLNVYCCVKCILSQSQRRPGLANCSRLCKLFIKDSLGVNDIILNQNCQSSVSLYQKKFIIRITSHDVSVPWVQCRKVPYQQGCRKFETVRHNKILNPKLSDERRKIVRHLAKVSKIKKYVYTPTETI